MTESRTALCDLTRNLVRVPEDYARINCHFRFLLCRHCCRRRWRQLSDTLFLSFVLLTWIKVSCSISTQLVGFFFIYQQREIVKLRNLELHFVI